MKAEDLKVGGLYVDSDNDVGELLAIKNNLYIFFYKKRSISCAWNASDIMDLNLKPYTEPKPPVVIEGVFSARPNGNITHWHSMEEASKYCSVDTIDKFKFRYTLENGKRKLEVIE